MPPDSATLARTSTPPPVPLGGQGRRESLSAADRAYIEREVGKRLDGSPLPLGSLLSLYDKQARLYEEAASQVGAQSGAALYIRAIVERLAALIAEARSPRGMAMEKLRRQLEQARATKGPIRADQFSEALAEVLGAERQRQLLGVEDTTGENGMDLMGQVTEFVYERKTEELKNLIEEAKRPGNRVTEEQLGNVVRDVLGIERQRQLLGCGDDGAGGSSAMTLLGEALEVVRERHEKALKDLIEQAKRPGSNVSDEQLSQAVRAVLGDERQRQLLGSGDDSAAGMDLVLQAMEVARQRHRTAIKSLVESAKRPGATVSKAQIEQAVRTVLGDERQRQLLGAGDASDPELMGLLEEAGKLYGGLQGASATGSGSARVEMGEIEKLEYIPRSPLR
jgi:hypothetical protein